MNPCSYFWWWAFPLKYYSLVGELHASSEIHVNVSIQFSLQFRGFLPYFKYCLQANGMIPEESLHHPRVALPGHQQLQGHGGLAPSPGWDVPKHKLHSWFPLQDQLKWLPHGVAWTHTFTCLLLLFCLSFTRFSLINNLLLILVSGFASGETHLRHAVFMFVCYRFIYSVMFETHGEWCLWKNGIVFEARWILQTEPLLLRLSGKVAHPTSSHLACFIMCEMSVMVLKWESEFNRIKYLNHLVLNGLVIITPNKIKFETLTPRSHEETAFKI